MNTHAGMTDVFYQIIRDISQIKRSNAVNKSLLKNLLSHFFFILLVMVVFAGGVHGETADEWIEIGIVFEGMDKPMEALAAYDKATQIDPTNTRAHNYRERAIIELGRYEVDGWVMNDPTQQYSTLVSYTKFIQKNPDNAKGWYNIACVLTRLGRYEKAVAAIDQAIHIDPGYANAWDKKSKILTKMGKSEESAAASVMARSLMA